MLHEFPNWYPRSNQPNGFLVEFFGIGKDILGTRYSPLKKINRSSVRRVDLQWYYTYEESDSHIIAKQVPIVTDDGTGRTLLIFENKFNEIFALNPLNGRIQWKMNGFDGRKLPEDGYYPRSLSAWLNPNLEDGQLCRKTIFVGVRNMKIGAIDASTGRLCEHFGNGGVVDYPENYDANEQEIHGINMKGPVIVVKGVAVVGVSLEDGRFAKTLACPTWAFDAHTGEKLWKFDPIPLNSSDPAYSTWLNGTSEVGAGNVWAAMSGDEEEGIVIMATSSASPDGYGGARQGINLYTSSIVAIEVLTGKLRWYYQTVHHDIWDYDIASQPVVTKVKGRKAVVVGTKTAMIFAFDIRTGEPLVDIEEVTVNPSLVEGEWTSPTQPFVKGELALLPRYFTENDVWSINQEEYESCKTWYSNVTGRQNGQVFTPSSLNGSFLYPGPLGGISFGGCASNPEEESFYCVVSNSVYIHQLFPRDVPFPDWCNSKHEQVGSPYKYCRGEFLSSNGHPCINPPWQTLVKINMTTGRVVWRVPIGYSTAEGYKKEWGSPTYVGGVSITESGLVLVTGTQDNHLWFFNSDTGETLHSIPVREKSISTPITYIINGVEYIGVFSGEESSRGGLQVFGLKLIRREFSNEEFHGIDDNYLIGGLVGSIFFVLVMASIFLFVIYRRRNKNPVVVQ